MVENLQERRRLNEELERVYMDVSWYASQIEISLITDRGVSWLDIFEQFHTKFNLLILISMVYPQMREQTEAVKKSRKWVTSTTDTSDDKAIKSKLRNGVAEFHEYAIILSGQGIIVPPSKG